MKLGVASIVCLSACAASRSPAAAGSMVLTAAEAACLVGHAAEGPSRAAAACGIEQERAPAVEIVCGAARPTDGGP